MLLIVLAALLCTGVNAVVHTRRQTNDSFYFIGKEFNTDKVTTHRYALIYDDVLPKYRGSERVKLLEIGLGCDMPYGAGHSIPVWRNYFKHVDTLDVWVAEYNGECANKWADEHPGDAHILVGDQSNKATLAKWVNDSGGGFDIIVDDGGHTDTQQTNSFRILWDALAPGGTYFLEDLVCNFITGFGDSRDPNGKPVNWIKQYIDILAGQEETKQQLPVKGLKSIQCARGICAFQKCATTDDGVHGQECD